MHYRKYIFNLAAVILVVTGNYNFSFDYNNQLLQGVGLSVMFNAGMYVMAKAVERYEVSQLMDPSENFQCWARNTLLKKQVKNVDSLVFKDDKVWTAYNSGGFIGVKASDSKRLIDILVRRKTDWSDEDRKKYAEITWSLLHENKHVQNYDAHKIGIIPSIGIPIIIAAPTLTTFLLSSVFFAASTLFYKRYTEEQADAYAFMNMSAKNLCYMEKYFKKRLECFEKDAERNQSVFSRINILVTRLVSIFSQIFFSGKIENQNKKIYMKILSFFYDPTHPDNYNRLGLVQEALRVKNV